MSDFETQPREQKPPKCPHCGEQPCMTGLQIVSYGMGVMAAIFVCGNCEKILGIAPLPPMNVLPQDNASKIVRPS